MSSADVPKRPYSVWQMLLIGVFDVSGVVAVLFAIAYIWSPV